MDLITPQLVYKTMTDTFQKEKLESTIELA
jgi:hypothetical protein